MKYGMNACRIGWVLLLAALAACDRSAAPPAQADSVDATIAKALATTAEANASVAAIEKQLSGVQPDLASVSVGSSWPGTTVESSPPQDLIQIEWNGPIEPLIRAVAMQAGYSLTVQGPSPVNPVLVTISGFKGEADTALARIDNAAFGFASATADSSSRTILLAYPD